jgi:OPA family glycerol-3-phosphate transporter-like MFS transporter 3
LLKVLIECIALGCSNEKQINSGVLGDNYDLRKMIAGGMWATGAIMLLFGMAAMADIHSLSFYAVLWGLNGLIQSCGWPANVAVM